MVDISLWQADASLNDLTPPDGWPEGMSKPTINNSARETMAAVKRLYEKDQWRDVFLDKNGAQLYSYAKGTDVRLDILGVDVSTRLLAGQRIRIIGATTVTGHILSVSYVNPDTRVSVALDGLSDATLAPGSTQFIASGQRIVSTNAIHASTKPGDVVVFAGTTKNDGKLFVATVVNNFEITVAGNYAIQDETVTPSIFRRVNYAGQVVPTAPTALQVGGVHSVDSAAYRKIGTAAELDVLRRVDVQPHAFKAERDLEPSGLPPKTLVGADATKVVRVNPGGTDYEIGPKIADMGGAGNSGRLVVVNPAGDGIQVSSSPYGARELVALKSANQDQFDGDEELITDLSNLTIPGGAGDGTRRIYAKVRLQVTHVSGGGGGASYTLRLRAGVNGTLADAEVYAEGPVFIATTHEFVLEGYFKVPNLAIKFSVTVASALPAANWRALGSVLDFDQFNYVHLRELGIAP